MKRTWIDYSKVRAQLSFADVLAHFGIEHDSNRDQIKINCPFPNDHKDTDPSCSINIPGNKFNCFGCQASGNTLEFIVLMQDGDPKDAGDLHDGARTAIDIMGGDPADFGKDSDGTTKRTAKPPKSPQNARKSAQRPKGHPTTKKPPTVDSEQSESENSPKENPVLEMSLDLDPTHPYLAGRGLDADICRAFGIGYCKKGIMNGRIAFRIDNIDGKPVAYAGRYPSDELPEGTTRYKLPKRFNKSFELYNIHRAKSLGKRHLVIVEGFWSAIRLHQAGVPAVALMGTAISERQAALVRSGGFRYITVILDGDDGGREATAAVIQTLARVVYVRVLELPEGEKPDTMPDEMVAALR